jgi:hypothetical protein
MCRRVTPVKADVSKEYVGSIFRVERINKLGIDGGDTEPLDM